MVNGSDSGLSVTLTISVRNRDNDRAYDDTGSHGDWARFGSHRPIKDLWVICFHFIHLGREVQRNLPKRK
jgi:hypothetical protein